MRAKILLTSFCIATTTFAQNIAIVSSPPRVGTFYLMSEPNWPPLPVDFYPGCSVYSLGDGKYLIDDREVAAKEMLKALHADIPPASQ